MKNLENHIVTLGNFIEKYNHTNSSVTQSTVGWQIDHSFRVVNGVAATLQKSILADYKKSFNWKRSMVLLIKTIPRGKARAPKSVQATEPIVLESLRSQLEEAKKSLALLNTLDKNSNFKHPYFGVLNLSQSILFLEIHTKHHLKIVQDCMK